MLTVDVIEDDAAMRTLLVEWLADAGYRVRGHGHAVPVNASTADAVVVDVSNLPLQGAGAIHHARTRFASRAVVGLSTRLLRPLSRDSLQARALGLDELLPKPCSRETLVGAVARAIDGAIRDGL